MKIFTLVAGVLMGSVASAKCLDNKLIYNATAPFEITRWDGSKQSAPLKLKDLCDEKDVAYKVAEALILTQQIQNEAHGPNPGSESVVANEGAFNFFKKRIEKIVIEDQAMPNGACTAEGVVAYVRSGDGKRTFICAKKFALANAFTNSSVLIHESRHVEGYSHAHCAHGTLKGLDLDISGGCDTDYPSQGSYGIQTGFKLDVFNLTKDDVLKQQARSEAVDDLINRFNELPWDLTSGVLTMSRDNNALKRPEPLSLSFFDGQKAVSIQALPAVNEDIVMTSRYGLPTFYAVDGQVTSYVYSPVIVNTTGTMAQDYRTKSTPSERNALLDVYYNAEYSCRLYTNALKCESTTEDNQPIVMNVSLASIKPFAIIEVSGDSSLGETSITRYIVDENGDRYKLPSKKADIVSFTANDLVKEDISDDDRVLGLATTDDGSVFAINDAKQLIQPNNRKWEKVPQYRSQRVEKLIPFTWSSRIENL